MQASYTLHYGKTNMNMFNIVHLKNQYVHSWFLKAAALFVINERGKNRSNITHQLLNVLKLNMKAGKRPQTVVDCS